jgi:hypothetical protein
VACLLYDEALVGATVVEAAEVLAAATPGSKDGDR